nr:bifunctional aspartate aminotransferase and glutamate/aspartate-prephenate aminotransferase [Tanacetum cinerariifolium]
VTITAGATEALYGVLAAVVRAGDEVIILEPAYDLYGPAVRLQGGVPRYVRLPAPSFRPDWEAVRAALTPRTRLIIVNTPHNPSGARPPAPGLAGAQLRAVVVWQNLPRHWLEGGLLPGPARPQHRAAAGAPVRDLRREHAHPARPG